jgi:glutathione synthase/RimK-type ligase-like ATP-grasp enzyme
LSTETELLIYPTLRELNIFEAKRTLINFLVINNIPHPATTIFYDYESARDFIEVCRFPLVFKTHVGSSANGVEILKNKRQALKLSRQLFNKYYMRKMETEKRNTDWGYLLLQEYFEDVKEYRIIKVGDSWFGHQKWKANSQIFLSGSGFVKWINPAKGLLDFCYDIAVKYHFTTMCFDIFENNQGDFLVNELQTWFGSFNPSQMYLEDGTPGRYRKLNGNWVFEAGLFNIYGNMLLRLVDFISFIQQEK